MISDRFGVSTLLYRELPLSRALELIGRTGFRKVDLAIIPPVFCPHYDPVTTTSEDDKRLKDMFDRYALRVSSLNVVPGYFNRDDPGAVGDFLRRCVDIADALGTAVVTIPSGAKVARPQWLESARIVNGHLRAISEYARDKGVVISVETPHAGTLTETVEEAVAFHEIAGNDRLKCTLDTSHVIRTAGRGIAGAVRVLGIGRINHIHLRDAIGEEIDFTPGKGRGDFTGFFTELKAGNYQGDYIFELEYDDLPESSKMKELDFAADYIIGIYDHGKIPGRLALRTGSVYQFLSRMLHDPKRELKRHRKVHAVLKTVKPLVKGLMPEPVYRGHWIKKYRWRKDAVVRHRPGSVRMGGDRIYKIGIVGCGWAGREMHGPGFERLDNARIVGAYDIDRDRTAQCARRFGCPGFDSLAGLVDGARPDIVTVCSREWAHYDAVMHLIGSGTDVFCEKIMATRFADARDMVAAAQKNKRVLAVNYNYRTMPGIRKLKEIIEQKALGELSLINMNVHAMSYHHALDLLFYLGGDILGVSGSYRNDDRIRAFGGTDWSLYDPDILYVPSINASVTCEFRGGALGIVNSSYYYPLWSFVLSVEAVFDHGCVTLNGLNMFDVVGRLSFYSPRTVRKVDFDHERGVYARGYEYTFYSSIESFMRRYMQGVQPETPGEQGLVNIILEKAISRSNAVKERIDFPEFKEKCLRT